MYDTVTNTFFTNQGSGEFIVGQNIDVLNTKIENILTEKNTKILPTNIKSGINILGVTGNVIALNGETKTITPTTSSQTILPSSGKNAITQVNVDAVTSSIDANITAGNIKKDVTILGVIGSYEGTTPSGTISITENGTVDVSEYASADVNVQGSSSTNNAKIIPKTNTYYNIYQYIQNVDDNYDISSTTILRSGFSNFSSLLKAPTMSTSLITDAQNLFINCESLVDVPVYDWSSLTAHRNYNMYSGCTSLSNNSLNNILQSCIGMTEVDTKTLKYIGLSSTQASICTGLSNWSACQSAGWTTGY